MTSIPFRLLAPLALVAALSGVLAVSGCGGSKPAAETAAGMSEMELAQAQRLYAQLVMESQLHRDRKAIEIAGNLLDYHAAFPRNDEVLDIAIDAATRLDETVRARRFVGEMLERYPASPLMDKTLLRGADLAAAAGDTLDAAYHLVRYHDANPARATRQDGTPQAAVYCEQLTGPQLARLETLVPGSALGSYLGFLRVREALREGDFGGAQQLAETLGPEDSTDRWVHQAWQLLADPDQVAARPRMASRRPVESNRIGLLSPLTEKYALLGNAFVDAALMAADAANIELESSFELLVEDTAGDPVTAALAARRLCAEEGAIVLLGAMMSAPTAAAALVADTYGVPIVSPTATNENVWKLGDGVFQTNMTGLFEVRLLAQLATSVLLKERFAILYPDNPEGRRDADVFSAEVESHGGRIVATASYPSQGTDFRAPILSLREYRPEVIFTPATVDQMVMLGPQLDFYKSGSLVLGLSNWNSERLADRAGPVLERALLPSDLAMFRPAWTAEFHSVWDEEAYPGEATPLALKTYQAVRMLLETIQESGAANRAQLSAALSARLANREFNAEGLDSFGQSVRMFRGGEITRFPAELFADAWAVESALADTLGTLPDEAEAVPGDDLDEE